MRLATFRSEVTGAARLGVIMNDTIIDVALLGAAEKVDLPESMLGLLDQGPATLAHLGRLVEARASSWPTGTALPLGNVRLLAPIPRPRKCIFGVAFNYADPKGVPRELPKDPVVFSKPPTSVIGPGEAIEHNASITQNLDWEVELAAIIGRTARNVAPEDALSYVFGYSVLIDISARDCDRAGQWLYAKGQDTYAPFGPVIVTADDIPDPQNLDLSLHVNGEEKQRSNTRHMFFGVGALIADISCRITLEPGDIIATGTPDGIGISRSPQEWLWPGDVVEAEVSGIGKIRHPVVAVGDMRRREAALADSTWPSSADPLTVIAGDYTQHPTSPEAVLNP